MRRTHVTNRDIRDRTADAANLTRLKPSPYTTQISLGLTMSTACFAARVLPALLMTMLGSTLADAGPNTFSLVGPEGGSTYAVAMQPGNPSVVLLSSARGILRSDNGGLSWQLSQTGLLNPAEALAFDPTQPNRVIAANGQLLSSEDAGQNFALLQTPANDIYNVAFAPDGTLYALTFDGRVFRSSHPFADWDAAGQPAGAGHSGSVIVGDPQNSQVVYIGVDSVGIYRSVNGGVSWNGPLTTGFATPTQTLIYSIAVHPDDSNVLLAGTSLGLHYSTNAGASWAVNEFSQTFWVGFDPLAANQASALFSLGQFMRSIDNGVTWTAGANIRVQGMPTAIFDPASAGRLLVATDAGVVDTLDYGATFTHRGIGVAASDTRAITVTDDGTVHVVAHAGLGAIHRRDGTYQALNPVALRNATSGVVQVNALAVCATNPLLMYAVNAGWELIRSSDGGESWSTPHPQFSVGTDYLTDVLIDPVDPLIAYVARVETGVWKTVDGGATWAPLPGSPASVGKLAMDPADHRVLYISGGDSVPTAIYKTIDGGANWTQKLAPGALYFNSFTFDPGDSNTVYATAFGGVRKSVDGGDNWTEVIFNDSTGGDVPASALIIDPLIPTTMVVVASQSVNGFLRTVDGGASWDATQYPGEEYPTVFNGAVVRPQQPQLLIMGTNRLGVVEYEIVTDLDLDLQAAEGSMPLGSTRTLTASILNQSLHAVSAAELRLTIPAWLTPAAPAGCTFNAPTVVCQIGAIRQNAAATVLQIPVTASMTPSSGQVQAVVESHERDPVANDNVASVALESSEQADLVTTFSGAQLTFDNYSAVELDIDVSNEGPNPSSQTRLTIDTGTLLTDASATSSQGNCSTAGAVVTCELGTVQPGTPVHVDLSATAAGTDTAAVTAVAQGEGTDLDSDQGATALLTLRAVADVSVDLADSVDPVTTGTSWQYTANVNNSGPDAGGATLVVALVGATPTLANASAGTCAISGANVTCTLNSITSGGSTQVVITATSASAGSATATATVAFDGTDSSADNNNAAVTTTKNSPPPPPSSGGKPKGGGGGSFDWLALALLGAGLARRLSRQRRSRQRAEDGASRAPGPLRRSSVPVSAASSKASVPGSGTGCGSISARVSDVTWNCAVV